MENNQTVVDFLEENIHAHCLINDTEDLMIDYNTLDELFMQAKKMYKEQIMDAHYRGYRNTIGTTEVSEQYYEKTYGE